MRITNRLKHLSIRYRLRFFVHRLSALLGGTVFAGAIALVAGPPFGFNPDWLILLVSALTLSVTGALIWAVVAPAGPEAASRFIEAADPDLHARLSTALELERSGQTGGQVREAQLQDAARLASALDVRRRISIRPPSHLLLMLTGSAAVFAVVTAMQSAPGPAALRANDADAPRIEETEETEEATAPAEPPTQGDSAPEEADAASVLSEPELPDEELLAMLESLVKELPGPEGQTPENHDEAPSEAGENDDTAAAADAGAAPSLQDLLDAAAGTADSSAEDAADTPGEGGGNARLALDADSLAEIAELGLETGDSAADGELVGTSDETGAGDSLEAGEGTQDLFGGEASDQQDMVGTEELDLEAETDPTGRRTSIDALPEARLTQTRMTPLGRMTWSRSDEEPTEREPVATGTRWLTARFHTPDQEY